MRLPTVRSWSIISVAALSRCWPGKVKNYHIYQIYDIAHNMAKVEAHEVDGRRIKVCVHRKGATRAFGPGSPDLPGIYRNIGQPVLVPGSMGTASWVLVGTKESMPQTFGSICHGAGRVMSRSKAKKNRTGNQAAGRIRKKRHPRTGRQHVAPGRRSTHGL